MVRLTRAGGLTDYIQLRLMKRSCSISSRQRRWDSMQSGSMSRLNLHAGIITATGPECLSGRICPAATLAGDNGIRDPEWKEDQIRYVLKSQRKSIGRNGTQLSITCIIFPALWCGCPLTNRGVSSGLRK